MLTAILVTVGLVGLLSLLTALEMGVFSARPEKLLQMERAGDKRAHLVRVWQRRPQMLLVPTQLLATLATILIGSLGQAEFQARVMAWLGPGVAYAEEWAFALVVVGMTLVTLLVSNLVPKHLGFVQPERVSTGLARFGRAYCLVLWPVSRILGIAEGALVRLLRFPQSVKTDVTEGDVTTLLAAGVRSGQLDEHEVEIVKNVLALSDATAASVMTAGAQIVWLEEGMSEEEVVRSVRESGRSFLPMRGADGGVSGLVKARDVLATGQWTLLPVVTCLRETPMLEVLETMHEAGARVALVGGPGAWEGLVSLHDVMEAMTGPLRAVRAV